MVTMTMTTRPIMLAKLAAVILSAAILAAIVCSAKEDLAETNQQARQVPALFDFARYQEIFNKQYASHLETITRRVYYMANAFRAYLSGIAYRNRKQGHFEATNEMSDWSPQELSKMDNHALAASRELREAAKNREAIEMGDEASYEDLAEGELEREIREALQEARAKGVLAGGGGGADEEERAARRKRELSGANRKPRRLSMDQLAKSNKPARESRKVLAKWDRNPKSNNPNYDPLGVEFVTRGLSDQQQTLRNWRLFLTNEEKQIVERRKLERQLSEERKARAEMRARAKQTPRPESPARAQPAVSPPPSPSQDTLLGRIFSWFPASKDLTDVFSDANTDFNDPDSDDDEEENGKEEEEDDDDDDETLPDVVFQDLRETGCLFEARSQGRCGSCYIFAGVTLAEYMFCKQTGKLVAFSEQYMVDCGKGRYKMMDGCGGGIPSNIPQFIHNFGLELRNHYPYFANEYMCPYNEDTDLKKTGFIRYDISHVLMVPVAAWERVLKKMPIYASVATPKHFRQYGGGVDSGEACPELANHGMVVIGHGREDGVEYWLFRNSHSHNWGVDGHWKLAKSAPERCIEHSIGYVYGTKDGDDFVVSPRINIDNESVLGKKLVPRPKKANEKPREDMVVE